ncbi:MAG: DUF1214 domain-containing protein [Deltaproteobacteria bacterium]|nr:DUF1214 domain-containing protein [Deltaproteobacteria bacterium]
MDRRDFLKGAAATGPSALLFSASIAAAAGQAEGAEDGSQSGEALKELRDTLAELEKGFHGPAWRLSGPGEIAEGRRYLAHSLQHALEAWLEPDADYPVFVRFETPEKKLLGDNPDAVYFTTPVSAEHEYRIRGNLADATYTSFTVERKSAAGGGSGRIGATLNDTEFEAKRDGSYEIVVSAQKRSGNWLRLDPDAVSMTTRHYYEREKSIAGDRLHHIPIMIENSDVMPPRPAPTDASIAAGVRRVTAFLKGTVVPPGVGVKMPRWVSTVPNELPAPLRDDSNQEVGFAAKDNVYSMAPFLLGPGQALVIRGRYPKCRFASVVLWNRFMQTFDYTTRQVSLNRRQTKLEPDGSFKIVVAGSDPGVPNWIDTEGHAMGQIFWRFQLPEEDIEPLTTQLVPLAKAREA